MVLAKVIIGPHLYSYLVFAICVVTTGKTPNYVAHCQ